MNDLLIGEEHWLKELFEKSVKIIDIKRGKKSCRLVLQNESDLTFYLKKTEHEKEVEYFREFTIEPQSRSTITIYYPETLEGAGRINFCVTNLLVQPNQGMDYSFSF